MKPEQQNKIISDRPDMKECAKLVAERDKAEERAKDLEEQVNIWKRSHRILVEDLDNWKQLAVAQEKQIIRLQENGPLIMVTDL